ncbi:hypothetical protein ACS0PU_004659 [Formica fusca]
MPMYVRVHIQSTSRMCFFYGDYNFVTAFNWKKKQQGTSRPNINVITVSTSSLSLPSSYVIFSCHTDETLIRAVQNIKRQQKQQQRARTKSFLFRFSLCTFQKCPDTREY